MAPPPPMSTMFWNCRGLGGPSTVSQLKENKEDKKGGITRAESSYRNFNEFIHNLGGQDLGLLGHPYTWENCRSEEDNVEERLDRVFVSMDWSAFYASAKVHNIFRSSSDHSLLLLKAQLIQNLPKKRFYFDKRSLSKSGIHEVVAAAWSSTTEALAGFELALSGFGLNDSGLKSPNLNGLLINGSNPVFFRAKRASPSGQEPFNFSKWSKDFNSDRKKKLQHLNKVLEQQRAFGNNRDWLLWGEYKCELNKDNSLKEQYWRQKFRINWLQNSDKISKYFHAHTAQRRKTNNITKIIKEDGTPCTSPEEITGCIEEFYSHLFTSEGSSGGNNLLNNIQPVITADMNSEILTQVDETEIKERTRGELLRLL
ncbi:30S ribosomal protein S12 [Striga asiatica]|uniref:30S ribosomal protein S12 n=1 Tax=Striga asiatica TaxID=4170 RepID=A0A5A7RGQ6_STRAF|nr:30S ribosomal protein S12 [Striga asiatica]